MNAQNDDSTARTRTGWRRIIPAWEYRHLRVFANLHIGASFFLAIFGTITLAYSAYGWTAFFWVLAAAHFLYGRWQLSIALRISPVLNLVSRCPRWPGVSCVCGCG